ncbi:MAG: glycosyltransferase family 9 protein, partial [Saprospiraceae bacterium]
MELSFLKQETTLEPGKDYIAIAPGSKHFTKRWPEYHFTKLCTQIVEGGAIPVLIGGTSDLKICSAIQEAEPRVINLCSENELFKIASILSECKTAVTCDSGLMHLACAVQTPVLVIFGSTVKEFGFTPYKNKSIVIENES